MLSCFNNLPKLDYESEICKFQVCLRISAAFNMAAWEVCLILPNTSRVFVVTNSVEAWDLRSRPCCGKNACSRDSHGNPSLVEVRPSPDKLSWPTVHWLTRPDKTFWHLALSDIARQAPILSQTCLNHRTLADKSTFFVGRQKIG